MKKCVFIIAVAALLTSCAANKKIIGSWQNDKGQTMIFKKDYAALWLFNREGKVDTFNISYRFNKSKNPNWFDLYNFQGGPLKGKTLFGVVSFSNNSFTCDFEAGTADSIRPVTFNEKEKQVFKKIK
ncbi:MAG: hypothetical protein K2X48_11235 [Chitinophagaceae bacterium]|nr:hypothetical protein [Chitinophagaceae bacterium]